MSSTISRVLAIVFVLLSTSEYVDSIRYTIDLEIRYFTNGELICDHPMLNITEKSNVDSLYWILQDGSLVTPQGYLDPKKYILQGLPDGVSVSSQPVSRYDGYNLTVLEVDDDVFGYYTCIVLFTGSADHPRLVAIRYGLNVDGADFSQLIEDYKHNAMVGGIAAGVVLVLIGLACFVWYNWCYEKMPEDSEEMALEEAGTEVKGAGFKDNGGVIYHNEAIMEDKAGADNGGFKGDTAGADNDDDTNSRL